MKNSEFVSTIVNDLKHLTKDEHISKRYILTTGQMNARFLMSQKMGDRSLFRNKSLFRTVKCLKLSPKKDIECLGVRIPSCESIMVSDEKVNGLIYGRYGNSIVSVSSIDGGCNFMEISPSAYRGLCFRPYAKYVSKYRDYFYEVDGRIYVPNSTVEAVDVTYIPYDESEIELQSGCIDHCECKPIWDYEFICPDELLASVKKATLQEVSIGRGISEDENPNLDSNIKSKTIN